MALLDNVKQALRISNTAYDTEITDLLATCKKDLQLAGLLVVDETDEMTKRAITVYVKANFGWDNPSAERLHKSYEMFKNHLSLSIEYAYFVVTFNCGAQKSVNFDGEEKETNDLGTVIFYSRAKNHVEYIVDGVSAHIDIASDTTIEVS